ncbi:hypothetical protein LA080_015958 [Diaporthe eres]|nr:hypothetical protein LA080_015958 [Diaporthe eres]
MEDVGVSEPFVDSNQDSHTALITIVSVTSCLLMITTMIAKIFICRSAGTAIHNFDILLFVAAFLMLQYAASILSVVSVTATRVSLSLLIRLIHNYGRPWGALSSSDCPAIGPIHIYNAAVNIMTDLQIYVLAVAMVWNIQSDFKTKCVVIALFSFRVLCPVSMIPTLLSQNYLKPSSDFTWLAVEPMIWMQISFNLSVITACIPTMKNIFDSLSGNFSVAIDAAYTLTTISGKSGLQTTALSKGTATSGSHAIVDSGFRDLTATASNHVDCTSNGVHLGARGWKEDRRSDSAQNLTDTIVVTEEVSIHFEQYRQPSPNGSHNSWHSADHVMKDDAI